MASSLMSFAQWTRKIVCVGRNYVDHAKELGNQVPPKPIIFLKPPSSIITAGQRIKLPPGRKEIHHEIELGVVIGKRFQGVGDASSHVAGYCLALDMTDRIFQTELKKDGMPWTLAKGFDTACPISDFLPVGQVPSPGRLRLTLKVNGQIMQNGMTTDMIFDVSQLIDYIGSYMTLEEGDVVLTGTPSGVGPVCSGDVLEGSLSADDGTQLLNMKFVVD